MHARTHTRTQIQRLICINFAKHILFIFTHTHKHSHTVTVKVKHTHSQSHTHARTQTRVIARANRLAAPVKRSVLVERTLAGGKGRQQLRSVHRQTTIPSGVGYLKLTVAKVRVGTLVTTTCLQGKGPAASAPRARTHALGLSVCMCLRLYVMHWQ